MKTAQPTARSSVSAFWRKTTSVLLVVLVLSFIPISHAQEMWKWIYKDDTCIVYADFTTMRIWEKAEGGCVDIYTMTNITNLGRDELLTGREINNKTIAGWDGISTIVTRQLFLLKERKVQMISVTYYDSGGKVLEEESGYYAPERWTALRPIERSQKVYDIIVNIANDSK